MGILRNNWDCGLWCLVDGVEIYLKKVFKNPLQGSTSLLEWLTERRKALPTKRIKRIITMYQTINVHQFRQAFIDMDRKENFSYDGLAALFEFFEEMAEDTGQEVEMDVIAICCDFSEMSWDEAREQYGNMIGRDEWEDCEDVQDEINTMLAMLNDHTMVVHYDDEKVLFQVF